MQQPECSAVGIIIVIKINPKRSKEIVTPRRQVHCHGTCAATAKSASSGSEAESSATEHNDSQL